MEALMTDLAFSRQTLRSKLTIPVLGVVALVAGVAVLVSLRPHAPVHAPNFELLARQSLVLKAHVAAAAAAFLLGLILFLSRKGAPFHRAAGWTWVLLMMTVAGSSLFITGLNGSHYSWIHLLSGWSLITLPLAVFAARRHRVEAHRRGMTGLFLGGMIVAGAFTFLPGRLMWAIFFY
jgi:uncharacterized membrane protein